MNLLIKYGFIFLVLALSSGHTFAQADEFCKESGVSPSFDSPFAHIPYVFGKITIKNHNLNEKFPNLTISLVRGSQPDERLRIGKSGNYCFRLKNPGGTLIVEIDGTEITRRTIPVVNGQVREDFEVQTAESDKSAPPGVISAKFLRPENPETVDLYVKTARAEGQNKKDEAINFLKEIVLIDPKDFIAWAKLGTIYQENKKYNEAIAAFKKSLEQKIEYTPAWINVAMIRIAQKEFTAAIEVLKQAAVIDPNSARIYQLLGEAYLLNRQGTLGAEALNKAISLDPNGMAECHLKLAHLYQLAGANKLAAGEYKIFLTKVPNHPERKKFETFIKKNPE